MLRPRQLHLSCLQMPADVQLVEIYTLHYGHSTLICMARELHLQFIMQLFSIQQPGLARPHLPSTARSIEVSSKPAWMMMTLVPAYVQVEKRGPINC